MGYENWQGGGLIKAVVRDTRRVGVSMKGKFNYFFIAIDEILNVFQGK